MGTLVSLFAVRRLLLIMGLAICAALVAIVSLSQPAGAQTASCSLSPSSGTVASSSSIRCSGFAAGETVNVYWDSTATTRIATFVASSTGAGSVSFKIPQGIAGAHSVIALGATSARQSSATFTIVPSVTGPTSVKVGQSVTYTAYGFPPNVPVSFSFGGKGQLIKGSSSSLGTLRNSFPVPAVPGGKTTVRASYSTYSATLQVTVTPSMQLSTTSAQVGQSVTAWLTGFGAGELIQLRFNGVNVGPAFTADTSGRANRTVTIPELAAGPYPLTAVGSVNTYTSTITITPSLTLSPTNATVGSTMTVTLRGYAANTNVTLNWYTGWHSSAVLRGTLTTTPSVVTTNAIGSVTATFVVPAAAQGSPIKVEGKQGALVASANFWISYNMVLSPTSGPAGSTVTVTLTGFSPSEQVTIRYVESAGTVTTQTTVTTSADGLATATFTVPAGTVLGGHTIEATSGGVVRVSKTFTVS